MSTWKRAVSSITLHNSYALPAVGFPMGQLIMIRLADADRGSRRAGRVPASLGWDPMASRIPDDCPIANLPLFMRPRNHARDFHSTGTSRSEPRCPPRARVLWCSRYPIDADCSEVGGTPLAIPELSTHSSMYYTLPAGCSVEMLYTYVAFPNVHHAGTDERLHHRMQGISRTVCFLQLGQLDQMTLPQSSQPPKDEHRRR
ncbi:hypothetical protein LZ31DRAFT_206450 [Colletotrichum somersetense]|nr:hypothetical protein LZ31DRAFT_206450 [Colletotrichum somersetense]